MLPLAKNRESLLGRGHIPQGRGHILKKLKYTFFRLFSVSHMYFKIFKYFKTSFEKLLIWAIE